MALESSSKYIGNELELFSEAANWKSYWLQIVAGYLGKHVLEVGAGIGSNTRLIYPMVDRLTALEPDPDQAQLIRRLFQVFSLSNASVVGGTLSNLSKRDKFDAILYIDVLEHIENDRLEVDNAYHYLSPGGHLIILSPAHQLLYTSFDKAIGHFRRYNRQSIIRLQPSCAIPKFIGYLDSMGLVVSFGNKILLRSSMPTPAQILFWDRYLVPISIAVDKLIRYSLGKSILAVWQKPHTYISANHR